MIAVTVLLVSGIRNGSLAQDAKQQSDQSSGNETLVNRGKYIVEGVAMCATLLAIVVGIQIGPGSWKVLQCGCFQGKPGQIGRC